ncbi:bzip transcription factor [Phytophthora infestans T30-4]|uniref:Bzip transcription factor n=1 Tax=Phytophthora infestans (strain T30-4) TaxID=403677 RepID=D0NIA8_PHYIT|nr:bzip transcription factor [Phytophthora infestans T30-4]EEY59193.1 bzip transcription factor [Phytophthora infestans T30-4]|eukprot:XP_002901207.1 bzip transcription factor [Phytophthora infestans T30-4]
MNRYPFAARPTSDYLVSLVRPRAPAGRYHANVVGTATPFEEAAISPCDTHATAKNPLVDHPLLHDELRAEGEASNALLSLTGRSSNRPTMALKDMNQSPARLMETHKRKREVANKSRRREQCRANQARYRDKQRNAQVQLKRKELDTLKRRYRDLASRERSNQSPWSIVAEVFRLLETSFHSPWRVASMQEMKNHSEIRQVLAILERSFAHDAAMGELRGADELMEQLLLFSQYFGKPHLKLQRIESVAPGVMAARAKLSITVTEFTLRHAFPHLEEPASGDDHVLLYQRLLGQRLECNCSLNFLFDEDSDRVVRLEINIDLASTLLDVLGSLTDVSNVLEHARVSSECVIGGVFGNCRSSDCTSL